jgi:hypothetical protein
VATPTPNLGLLEPLVGEFYSVQTTNDNNSKIDAEVGLERKFAKGRLNLLTGITNSGAIGSTLTIINNIASFTFKGGRKYDIVYEFSFTASSAGEYENVAIFSAPVGDAAGLITGLTCLQSRTFPGPGAGLTDTKTIRAHFDPATDTTVQIKVGGKCLSGGGFTFTIIGNSGTLTAEPNQFYIEDKGAQY